MVEFGAPLYSGYMRGRHGYGPTIAGKALQKANAYLLAWICGPAEAFADHAHLYRSGVTVEKQIALLNDRRDTLHCEASWTLTLDGRTIARGASTGEAGPASTRFIPLHVELPKTQTDTSAVLAPTTPRRAVLA